MGKGKDRATLGQISWVHSSGGPHIFCPCLSNLYWAHIFLIPSRWQSKCRLASVGCGWLRGTHLPPLQGLQHFNWKIF